MQDNNFYPFTKIEFNRFVQKLSYGALSKKITNRISYLRRLWLKGKKMKNGLEYKHDDY